MTTTEPKPISTPQKILFFFLLPLIALKTLITYLNYPTPTSLHFRQRLAVSYLQSQRKILPWSLLCWITKRVGTNKAITQYCLRQKIPQEVITLTTDSLQQTNGPPATLHILAIKENEGQRGVMIYFHGGGYVNPLRGNAHMPFIIECAKSARVGRAVVVEYSLSPEFKYPVQLIQCIESVRYVISQMHVEMKDIILAGDSAGGQLVGAILAHSIRQCTWSEGFESKGGRFGGALMVSPFVRVPLPKSEGKGTSYEGNEKKDYLDRKQVDLFKKEFGGDEKDVYTNLCIEEEIWKGLERVVEKVIVVVGTGEVFLDCCRVFNERCLGGKQAEVKRAMKREENERLLEGEEERYLLVECEGEVHVQPALDAAVGYKDGLMNEVVMSWLGSNFGGSGDNSA
ncbi:Alpha/Beta hydrolase protein [Podospora fimiseda]|uniref:Alpha/Beta hydrolase protein n=1 Tax=Podospora fimiseda TaxID=252190 RepID=A0AAN6YL52_9PEZI|nr:Alpha/Beta hydrolase protein [Podospora fimiseda]